MKKLILLLLLLPVLAFGQYNQEITTEESFENSDLFFESYYLNTFGMHNFKQVAPGLIKDQFLDLYLNPANLPDLGDKSTLVYLDFVGDREQNEIAGIYPYPYYSDIGNFAPVPDPRWLTNSRQEPDPIVSLGILNYPLGELNKNFFVGGTYQLLHKEENFYTVPYYIYNSRYYYDSFGNGVMPENSNYPIIDRSSGEDEMITTAHLFSVFTGFRFSDKLQVGASLNGVVHSRAGSYLNQTQDEYGNIDYNEWENYSLQERNQDYSHLDLNLGVNYQINNVSKIGLKAGILTGTADQDYSSQNDYLYIYNDPSDSTRWNDYMSNSATYQQWKQEGSNKYISLIFNSQFKNNVSLNAYYKFTIGSIDHSNNSAISDTSDYYYSWEDTFNNYTYESYGLSSTYDMRAGSGTKSKQYHEAALNFNWLINESFSFTAGAYLALRTTEINSTEPVITRRVSESHSTGTNPNYVHHYTYVQSEDKILNWNYESNNWTFQIPLILNFKIDESLELLLGLNRILTNWSIENTTLAYFNYRDRVENGIHSREENFGERYKQPTQHFSENNTDFITGLKVSISPELRINLIVNPEFENSFRFTQWQLSFYGLL